MVDGVELERRKAVAAFIVQRVEEELHQSWKKTCALAGIRSESLLRRFKRHPDQFGISLKVAAGLDKALELERGSIERMLKGKGDPIRKPGSPGASPTAPNGAPPSMIDILRRWNRLLTAEDAMALAEDLFTVYTGARKQGYDQGFEDGRAVPREASTDPAPPSTGQAQA